MGKHARRLSRDPLRISPSQLPHQMAGGSYTLSIWPRVTTPSQCQQQIALARGNFGFFHKQAFRPKQQGTLAEPLRFLLVRPARFHPDTPQQNGNGPAKPAENQSEGRYDAKTVVIGAERRDS